MYLDQRAAELVACDRELGLRLIRSARQTATHFDSSTLCLFLVIILICLILHPPTPEHQLYPFEPQRAHHSHEIEADACPGRSAYYVTVRTQLVLIIVWVMCTHFRAAEGV
jgi:hypothetical protein